MWQFCFIKQSKKNHESLKRDDMKRTMLTLAVTLTLIVQQAAAGDLQYVGLDRKIMMASFGSPANPGTEIRDLAIVSERAQRDFRNRMPQAVAKWYKVEDGYIARFSDDGIVTTVFYTQRGSWMYTMHSSDATKLDSYERATLREAYSRHHAYYIQRIEHDLGNCTLIYLESNDDFRTVTMAGDDIQELKRFYKR